MTLHELLSVAVTVLLVAAGGTLIYAAVSGFQVVVYRRAVLWLGTSGVLFVVGWVNTEVWVLGLIDSGVHAIAGVVVLTVAAALHLAAVWLFARDFVRFDTGTIEIDADVDHEDTGGFWDE